MDDNSRDVAISPDIERPRHLFQRYDSASGSSESGRSSFGSSSRGSYVQSPRRQNDATTRRTRTTTWTCSENKSSVDKYPSSVHDGKGRERSNGVTSKDFEAPDAGNTCAFCDTLVYERQYYLWHSQYTKSSLCSRCSRDSDGMRYISYWGTPSYEIGSWRKRYRAGRSMDIDLSPLLEVLERIDRIDTSMGGRKSSTNKYIDTCHDKNNNITIQVPKLECSEIKESDEMAARRRRRLENRKVIDEPNETKCKRTTNQYLNSSPVGQSTEIEESYKETSVHKIPLKSTRIYDYVDDSNNKDEKHGVYSVSEMSDTTEEVDVIEPLNVLNVIEQIPIDTAVNDDCREIKSSLIGKQDEVAKPYNPVDMLSAENIAKYRKRRRKSNYEDFVAGLKPVSEFKRRSTAAEDLSVCHNPRKDDINATKNTKTCEGESNFIEMSTYDTDAITAAKGTPYRTVAHNHYRDIDHEEERKIEDTEAQKVYSEFKNTKRKFQLKRRKTPYPVEISEPDKATFPGETDTKITHIPSSNQRRRSRTLRRMSTKCVDNSSSDEEIHCAAFSDIRRRFENVSKETTLKNGSPMFHKQSSEVSKGNFRSRYIKMAERKDDVYSDGDDEDDENYEDNYSCSLSEDDGGLHDTMQNKNKRNIGRETKKYENTEMSKSDFTHDASNQCHDRNNLKYSITSIAETLNTRLNENNSNQMTDKIKCLSKANQNEYGENVHRNEIDNCKSNVLNLSATKHLQERERFVKGIPVKNKLNLDIFQCSESSSDSTYDTSVEPPLTESQNDSSNNRKGRDTVNSVKNENSVTESRNSSETLISYEQNNKVIPAAKVRERKYKLSEGDEEHENPNIERIKRKLARKPTYEDEDSNSDELNDQIMELNGSDDEEVELGWRTRGYNTDFYMSRRSITGGEILDRYKRAISKRRSRNSSRQNSRNNINSSMSSIVEKVMTHSDPVSRCGLRHGKKSSSAPITRSGTQTKLLISGNENGDFSGHRQGDSNGRRSSGVSAAALKAALDRAANCSKRTSKRIQAQLQPSDSCGSSS